MVHLLPDKRFIIEKLLKKREVTFSDANLVVACHHRLSQAALLADLARQQEPYLTTARAKYPYTVKLE